MNRFFFEEINAQLNYWDKQNNTNYNFNFSGHSIFKRFLRKLCIINLKRTPFDKLEKYFEKMSQTYELLNDSYSKKLYSELVVYRAMNDKTNITLSIDTPERKLKIEEIKFLKNNLERIDTGFKNIQLECYDLGRLGFPIRFFGNPEGIYVLFVDKQYESSSGRANIQALKNDVVLDLGACWGDSSLYFSELVGDGGKVFAFEFIPKNIEIFMKNIHQNASHAQRIKLVRQPVWSQSGLTMYYLDKGPASLVSFNKTEKCNTETTTTS